MRMRHECSQQTLSNEEDNLGVRQLTEEERRAYTIAATEQARSYRLQKRNK